METSARVEKTKVGRDISSVVVVLSLVPPRTESIYSQKTRLNLPQRFDSFVSNTKLFFRWRLKHGQSLDMLGLDSISTLDD